MGKYAVRTILILSVILIVLGVFLSPIKINTEKNMKRAPIKTFTLTATPDYSDMSKHNVFLDWSSYGSTSDTIFKGYQSKDNGTTWESISLMDYTSVQTVKVLNVYPEQGDGLKSWMESTTDSITGEVLGKGIIKVDKVGISAFNTNPSSYLKKTNAAWNYDVVVFGFWDRNYYYDLSTSSKNVIDTYIKDGQGVVFGHDTGTNNSFSAVDTRIYSTDTTYQPGQINFSALTSTYLPMHWEAGLNVGSTEVEITKKGLLTQYPWDLGPVGTKYTIPTCHSWGQVLDDTSNVWMKFTGVTETVPGSNFYIVTNNNVAMIQTGHTSGQSMEAEQKILANLIFYSYQLTSETNVHDYSGMDLISPTKATVSTTGGYNGVSLNISSTDRGSEYEYYIEGYTKPDMTVVTSRSNTVDATVTTGIKGYYYVIDNQTTNDFNTSSATYTANNTIPTTIADDGKYIHVKVIDNYNNISEVSNTKIEVPKYNVTLKLNGGTLDGSTNDKVINAYSDEVVNVSTPTKENQVFNNWEKESECSTIVTNNSITVKDTCSLIAIWKDDYNHNGVDDDIDPKYTIKYQDGVDGSVFEEQSTEVLVGLNTPDFEGSLIRQNYIFMGWNPTVVSIVEGNVTYVAIWEEDLNNNNIPDSQETKYTITYQDGQEDRVFSKQIYTNQLIDLATPAFQGTPTRENYIFTGWNPIVSSKIIGNATYTAIWAEDFNHNGIDDSTEEKYTVIYKDGVDESIFENQTYNNLLVDTKTPEFQGETTREFYVFMGWSPSVSNTIQGNAIYTATWAEDKNSDAIPDEDQPKYTIIYKDGCDEESFEDVVIDNILTGMDTPTFEGNLIRKNYVFVGWKPLVQEKTTEDMTYVAEWEEDINNNGIPDKDDPKYTVTFRDGMNNRIFNEYSIQVLEGMTIPEFDRSILQNDKYEFAGWNIPEDTIILKDEVFTAKWNEIIRDVPNTKLSRDKYLLIWAMIITISGSLLIIKNLNTRVKSMKRY